jgi:uncharacterized protein (TIGR00730 family)
MVVLRTPSQQRQEEPDEVENVQLSGVFMSSTIKAYKNLSFLNSPEARTIRILCEYEEPRKRFREKDVENTIVLFGSARTLSREQAVEALSAAEAGGNETEITTAQNKVRLSRYYEEARELSKRLTQWSTDRAGSEYLICTGGGPGIMEAGNRGAADIPGGRSVGLGISLPFEEDLNAYVSEDLAFEFHYFFTRKYWFMYLAKALIVFPGGFGTLDEFAELLTLVQTQKITKSLPIILYGPEYWSEVINVDKMVEWGTISAKDLDLLHTSDSVDDAFDHLVSMIEEIETRGGNS